MASKLDLEQLADLKLGDLELAAARAVFLGLHRTPGFRIADFMRLRMARRYANKLSKRWIWEHHKVIAALVARGAVELGMEREKTISLERLEAFELVQKLALLPEDELAQSVRELGETAETGFALIVQAARLGVQP